MIESNARAKILILGAYCTGAFFGKAESGRMRAQRVNGESLMKDLINQFRSFYSYSLDLLEVLQ